MSIVKDTYDLAPFFLHKTESSENTFVFYPGLPYHLIPRSPIPVELLDHPNLISYYLTVNHIP